MEDPVAIESSGEVDVAKPEADDKRFYSVTTIIGCLDKPALMYWAAEQTALAACDQAGYLEKRIASEGREAIVKELRDARFKTPKTGRTAADLGTAVHDACEQLAFTGKWPEVDDEMKPFVENADRLMQKLQPKFEMAEAAVYNPTYGYAGTLDAIAVIDGQRVLIDWKTTRKDFDSRGKVSGPYPEHALQLSAYRYSELVATWRARRFEQMRRRYYLLSATETELGLPMPKVDGAMILHLTPGHGMAVPVRCDEAVFECFLYTQECFRWTQEISKTVIGSPFLSVAPED